MVQIANGHWNDLKGMLLLSPMLYVVKYLRRSHPHKCRQVSNAILDNIFFFVITELALDLLVGL